MWDAGADIIDIPYVRSSLSVTRRVVPDVSHNERVYQVLNWMNRWRIFILIMMLRNMVRYNTAMFDSLNTAETVLTTQHVSVADCLTMKTHTHF